MRPTNYGQLMVRVASRSVPATMAALSIPWLLLAVGEHADRIAAWTPGAGHAPDNRTEYGMAGTSGRP